MSWVCSPVVEHFTGRHKVLSSIDSVAKIINYISANTYVYVHTDHTHTLLFLTEGFLLPRQDFISLCSRR